MPRVLKRLFLVTDIGFITYWLVVAFGLIPAAAMFSGYAEPAVAAWNWSFLPLDLLVSATGLLAVGLADRGSEAWRPLASISLVLTACAGLMALCFWSIRGDLEAAWWVPNLYLLLYPLPFIARLNGLRSPRSVDASSELG